MGCDGGTIPTRDELVRLKKKPEQKDRDSERAFRWKHCAITQEPLQMPIVACELGGLYSKESVIEFILDRSKFPRSYRFEHIRGLKDVTSLQLTPNPAYKDPEGDKGGVYIDRNKAQFICPITGLEMSGKYRFCFLKNCGCVFAERALKEIQTDTCNKCGKPYQRDNIILLNGTDAEVEDLQRRMEERRTKAKLEKKSKKRSKAESTEATTSGSGEDAPSTSKQAKLSDEPSTSKLTNGKEDSKLDGSGAPSKLTNGNADSKLAGTGLSSKGATSKLMSGKDAQKEKAFKSIQHDPKASSVYKSLFTTSDKAKNQPKAHWVTHNPCYY